jgi:hypothetical protein
MWRGGHEAGEVPVKLLKLAGEVLVVVGWFAALFIGAALL